LRSRFDDSSVRESRPPALGAIDRWIVAALVAVACGYLLTAFLGLRPWLITIGGGVVMVTITLIGRKIKAGDVIRVQPLSLYAFVIGLAIVVRAADAEGLLDLLGRAVERASAVGGLSGLFAVTIGTALGTNIVNNWTMALAISGPLLRSGASDATVAGSMLGADIGPNLSVVGSLATLIWLTEVRRGGLAVSGRTYLRLGLITTIPAILAATLVLHLLARFA
jgi:arsenical pump membrane protein